MPAKKARTPRDYDLRGWRERRNLKQYEAARILGLQPGHLSQIERGVRRPSTSLALRLSAQTGISLERLLTVAYSESA